LSLLRVVALAKELSTLRVVVALAKELSTLCLALKKILS
jgi:hypothetical protein